MKKITLALFLFFAILNQIKAQRTPIIKKMSIWEVVQVGGAAPAPDIENQKLSNTSYLLYITVKAKTKLNTYFVWIKDKAYSIHLQKITALPVKFDRGEILVAKTINEVYECQLTQVETLLTPQIVTTLLQKNAAVFEYSINNKKQYLPIKVMGKLTRELM